MAFRLRSMGEPIVNPTDEPIVQTDGNVIPPAGITPKITTIIPSGQNESLPILRRTITKPNRTFWQ